MRASRNAFDVFGGTGPPSWIPIAIICGVDEPKSPPVPVTQLLDEIRGLGYPGSANLLHRYPGQGRADDGWAHLSPRRATGLLPARPENPAWSAERAS